jgi:hypothetical protein
VLERLKRALVNSFVGALALGWLFAQGLQHLAYVFSAPVAGWLSRREYRRMAASAAIPTGFSLQDALPELMRSFALLVVAYGLLRWLYYEPTAPETTERHPEAEGQHAPSDSSSTVIS